MSRPTLTLYDKKAREAVYKGVMHIYNAVSRTLGPEGKNALIYRTMNRGPRITNDGYTVAEVQNPKDIFTRLPAEAFRESCKRTNEKAGDGTTTTVTIGGKLFQEAYKVLTDGATDFTASRKGKVGVMALRKQILESASLVKAEIRKRAKKVKTLEELEKIAIVSVEDVELGKTIAQMAYEVGVDGFIDTVEGYKGEIETEVIKGMRFPAKVAAKAFVNNPARYEMVATDCPILLTNYALDNASEIATVLKAVNSITSKVIVAAPSFSENVLINMVNATKQGYFIYPVLVPALRTEQFEDLAVYTGGTFIDKQKGKLLKNIIPSDLGFLEKLIVKDTETKEDAVATGGKGTIETVVTDVKVDTSNKKKEKVYTERTSSPIQERIATLKGQLLETRQEMFKKQLEYRIASMSSAVGIIRVGDSTQANSLYRKLKIEDAVYACKAALRGGYVKGGGLCLKEIAEEILEESDILRSALTHPYELIQNSVDGGLKISDDIIDPAEVVYYAVEHSTSVVANLITVEVLTPEVEDEQHDGEKAIASAINEMVITEKRRHGLLKENEEEEERERMNGWSQAEFEANGEY